MIKGAKFDSKIGLFTHRNSPILRAKLDLYDLQCSLAAKSTSTAKKGASPSEIKLRVNRVKLVSEKWCFSYGSILRNECWAIPTKSYMILILRILIYRTHRQAIHVSTVL